jgi:hypothetical protein
MDDRIFMDRITRTGEKSGISDETRIIALNSLLEAARAGKGGEGLAVLTAELFAQVPKKGDKT